MTLSGLSFTLCSVFFSRWIIASVVLLLTCPGHVMTQHMVNYRISEELPRGTLIGSLATHLPLPLKTKLPQLRFRSIQSEHAQYFHVNISTGELRVRMRLDRETICPILIEGVSPTELLRRASISQDTVCQLSFRVNILRVTQSGVEIKNLIRVVITLDDVDDNRCQFIPSNNQELYIPENVNGTTYDLHLPVDLDTEPRNNINKTSISLHTHSNGTIKHPFGLSIDKTESVIAPYQIKLVVLEPMDYEQVRQYKMIVYVSGSTVNSECRLDLIVHVLDTNDHAPVFVRKTDRLSLSENTTIGQPFYTVKAIDDDVGPVYGALRFLLSPSNSPQLHLTFAIHERNGSVYLKRALNYGQQSSYKLSLRVQNPEETGSAFLGSNRMYTSSSSSLDVRAMNLGKSDNLMDEMDLYIDVIDVNDHWPEIVIYALNGSRQITLAEHIESIPADFAVVSVTDEDSGQNGEVSCHLFEPHRKWFELTRIDQNPLVTVTAASENQTTSDTNGNRGALYKLAALRSFDREVETIVNFRVVCEDHGNPRLTSNMTGILWILDLNDHSPEFPVTTVHMQVNEDSDPTRHLNDFVIGQINATDKDSGENAKLRYSLVEPELQHLITIDPINGLMRSKGLLDFETNQTILFTVAATDMGNPPRTASCRVHLKVLDYNDHAPEFEQSDYDFSVQENLPQGFPIGSIQVCDRDVGINAVMNFRLSQMETPEMLFTHTSASQLYPPRTQIPFRLSSQYASHSECYKVVLLTSSPLNREANLELANRSQNDHVYLSRPYQFYVIAEDRGSPALTARARIQIRVTDVNDEAPVFVEPSILHRSMLVTVYQPIDVEIFRVHAVDRDAGNNGTVKYKLGAITLYESTGNTKAGLQPCDQPSLSSHSTLRAKYTTLDLTDYFQIDPLSGSFSLKSALPDQLIDLSCRIAISARDGASVPMESTIHMCLTITDALDESDGLNRTGSTSGTSMRLRGRNSRTTFYLYVIAAISIVGLLASIAFVLSAYFLWHRPRSKTIRDGTTMIRFHEVNNMASRTNVDKMEYVTNYDSNLQAVSSGRTLIDWPNTTEAYGTGVPADHWTTMRYNSMDQGDKTLIPCESFTGPGADWINSVPRPKPNQYAPFVYSPQQSIYYHTMRNTHALETVSMNSPTLNY